MRRTHYVWLAAAVSALALTASGADAAVAATPSRAVLTGTAYQSDFDLNDEGPAATDTTVTDNVYLSVRDPGALAAAARSVSSPGTAGYGKYTNPGQVQAANQLAPAQVAQIRDWLSAAGLTVSQPTWRDLSVTGTIGQLENAFDVTFDDYYYPPAYDAPVYYMVPTTDMSVPGDLAGLVLGVGAFAFMQNIPTQNAALAKAGSAAAAQGSVNLPAKLGGITYPDSDGTKAASSDANCSQYWDQSTATGVPAVDGAAPPDAGCGYTPGQLRRAYGVDSSKTTGRGQTVAVVTPSMDTLEQDVDTWSRNVGTAPLRPGQLTVVPTPDGSAPLEPDGGGYLGMIENTLDVEAVHGMAPDADIDSVGLSTQEGGTVLDSMAYILDHTHATIVSMSLTEALAPGMQLAYDQILQEGALQGVGFYLSSGDGVALDGSFLNPLSGSDWATSVGGTTLAIGPNGSREWETGWGDEVNFLSADGTSWQQPGVTDGGAGGGQLVGEPQPWYQHGIVPAGLAKAADGELDRVGPDISMDADPTTGYLVGGTPVDGSPTTDPSTWQYTQQDIGGTSLSAPLFAGIQALAQQADGGKAFGFANPVLYQHAGSPAIRDVTEYTLPDGAAPTAVGYDTINGVANTPLLITMLGRMVPYESGLPPLPSTGPGFDTETGLGTPSGAYLRSFGRR